MMRIKLEKGEKIPEIRVSQTGKSVPFECPNCKNDFSVFLHEWDKKKWFYGECWQCGYKFIITKQDCDLIQPSSPLFELVYNFNPKDEIENKRKIKEWQKEQRKAELEEKYDTDKTLKPWVKKDIKKAVLEEKMF